MGKRWTEKEVEFLKKNYENMSYREIGEIIGRSSKVTREKARKFGLRKRIRKWDLTNKRFGRSIVLKYIGNNKHGVCRWLCRCDCGKKFVTNTQSLVRGNTKSCGCYQREVVSKRAKLDLIGQRFGRLLVIKEFGKAKNRSIEWLCKCDCGNETIVPSQRLRNGDTKSCGCLSRGLVSKRSKSNKYGYKHGLYGTREYIKSKRAQYKAMKLNQTSPDADIEKINYIYRVCEIINQFENDKYEVDHIKPLSKGGLHHQDNLQILLANLNRRKHARITDEYKGITLKDLEQDGEKYNKYLEALEL
jgi:hypothetical protein